MRPIRTLIACVLYLAIANLTGGCTYYKVRGQRNPDQQHVADNALVPGKYIIIHSGVKARHMAGISLSRSQTDMTGRLESISPDHLIYLRDYEELQRRNNRGPFRYKRSVSKPTQEIHIYLAPGTDDLDAGPVSIPLTDITKIEIYDPAVGATVASHILGGLAIAAGLAVIVGVVVLATKTSCPFLYVQQAGRWVFTGEMYGGAISAPQERDDYMPLPDMMPTEGRYALKIANELRERQYTNIAELLVIDHKPGSFVLADKTGTLHAITDPLPASSASAGAGQYSGTLAARDSVVCRFDGPDAADPAFSSLDLSFRKPAEATKGRLVIHARNSYWLDYMFARFTEQFGTRYPRFAAEQKKAPKAEAVRWSLEQGIPLTVQLQTGSGWQNAGYFDVVGPLASRDLVMPIDLSVVKGNELKLRLRCGARFWELDYAALDFSEEIPLRIMRLSPVSAIDEAGRDSGPALTAADDQYLEQAEPGTEAVVQYDVPAKAAGMKRSIVFHSRGYYEYIRSFTNKPDLLRLLSFKKPGAFTRFAASEYRKIAGQKDFLATALNN